MRTILVAILAAYSASGQTDLIGFNPSSRIEIPAKVEAVAFASDGSRIVIGTKSGAYLSKIDGGSELVRFASGEIHSVAIARDGSKMAAGAGTGEVVLANGAGATITTSKLHRGPVLTIAFSPDGSRMVSSGADKSLILSDAATGREISRLANPVNKIFVFAGFSAQNNSCVGVSESGLIVEWDPATGKVVRQTQDSDTTVFAAALNGSGKLLAVATEFAKLNKAALMRQANPSDFYRKERLAVYDLSQGKVVKEIDGVDGQHRGLSFSADSRYLSAGREKVRQNFFSVYDLQRGIEVQSTPAAAGALASAFSPDGRWFTGVSQGGALAVFATTGIQRGDEVGDLRGSKYQITSKQTNPLLAPSAPLRLAVMDLETNGTDASLGRAVADQIRNRVNGAPNVEVIERRQWTQVLAEQNLQVSDRFDPLTAVGLGRALGIRKMIFGSISRLDTTFTINVRVIDVETLKNDGEREVTCQRCTLEDLPGAVAVLKTALVKE